MRVEDPQKLRATLLANAGASATPAQKALLSHLAAHHASAIAQLRRNEWRGIPFVPTTFGVRPRDPLPGARLLGAVRRAWGLGDPLLARVCCIERVGALFQVLLADGREIRAAVLVVATGGSRKGAVRTDGGTHLPDVGAMVARLGGEYDPNGVMRHPFFLDDDRLPKALVSGYFVVNAEFFVEDTAGNLHRFLPAHLERAIRHDDYHHLFPEIAEVFAQAQKRGRVVMRSLLTRAAYKRFVRENEYGYLFRNFPYGPWLERIPLRVADHYSLGGLRTNEYLEVEGVPGCFALGEAVSLYGGRRLGGMGHTDSIVLARRLALGVAEHLKPSECLKRMVGNEVTRNDPLVLCSSNRFAPKRKSVRIGSVC